MENKKYVAENIVNAIYDNTDIRTKNPFIEAMPGLMSESEFKKEIESYPSVPYNLLEMSREKRREQLLVINELFIPMDYMYEVYDFLYRGICLNYKAKTTTDYVRKINLLYYSISAEKRMEDFYATQSFSGALLGVPGIGKTSTIRRSLNLIPQVILHDQYNGEMFYCKQITYLVVECPHDCSVKTLAYSIIAEIDKAIGSDYISRLFNPSGISSSSLAVKVKIICLNNHVGIIVIDEIQNAIRTAINNKQVRSLIKFLVELTNEAYVSLCFTGTLDADNLFGKEEHLMRRTEGYRLLPLKRNKTFYDFMKKLWTYQMTLKKVEFNEKIANRIYDYSKGIPSYIIKIFQEAQVQAILSGREVIDDSIIKEVISKNHITPCVFYQEGISISDFINIDNSEIDEIHKTKRGRPVEQRDSQDLIVLSNSVSNNKQFINKLKEIELLDFFGGNV